MTNRYYKPTQSMVLFLHNSVSAAIIIKLHKMHCVNFIIELKDEVSTINIKNIKIHTIRVENIKERTLREDVMYN